MTANLEFSRVTDYLQTATPGNIIRVMRHDDGMITLYEVAPSETYGGHDRLWRDPVHDVASIGLVGFDRTQVRHRLAQIGVTLID
jgi:hypothetical protein